MVRFWQPNFEHSFVLLRWLTKISQWCQILQGPCTRSCLLNWSSFFSVPLNLNSAFVVLKLNFFFVCNILTTSVSCTVSICGCQPHLTSFDSAANAAYIIYLKFLTLSDIPDSSDPTILMVIFELGIRSLDHPLSSDCWDRNTHVLQAGLVPRKESLLFFSPPIPQVIGGVHKGS